MLEIIALFFLTKRIAALAMRKSLRPGTWKLYAVLAWFAAEIAGLIAGIVFFGKDNLFGLILFALCCAVGGYLIVQHTLQQKPDVFDDDINNIGT